MRDIVTIHASSGQRIMAGTEKHEDDTTTGALRPVAWIVIFIIASVSLVLLLEHFNVF